MDFTFIINYVQPLLGWLALLSLITFVLSLVLIPLVIGRLHRDCFLKLHHNNWPATPSSIGSVIILILRNLLGLILLMAGIVMLFLPGQGLLTILLGALLISFPGKRKIIYTLVCQPKIQQSMDWIRKKRKKPPFQWPQSPAKKAEN
jgi:hypothetical protein